MTKKEQLIKQIEQERKRLNFLIGNGERTEKIYQQSQVVDRLIEQYIELAAG
ncbi:MAG: Spo0E family sporulation regulatory protein-aspartic acid phosphatase [Lachnospiraceae bacterium]|nr:Spo0E family sporulation regulatory protein-aspartic acid phosphatase [Lachnospiraceae bacterium]